ncbi:TRAF-like, SKP1/BTB/POZ domain protein [Artemisia annua]|uniref:TRAF-like, SKP1/BTB/POZ domain protein n=1 Tax=Artemisia annua TaxID=35608 RepID=A0A2U1KXT4_ARTAN|nr:TRAF-like, SKP1/BTB/POZ domain protein [Artemisia annua]
MGIGKHIASDSFTVGGYQWAVYFYPDGKNHEDNSTYVSLFIALVSEGSDVRALFELTMVDQSGNERHKIHSHFDRSLESGPYTLKYRGTKGMGIGKHIASDSFTVGGYQWAVYFYPDGKNHEDNSTYVSLFIALVSEGSDVRALFELTMVDQSGNDRHKIHSHFDRSLESGPYTLKYRGSIFALVVRVDLPSLMRILMPVIACLLTYCLLTQLGSNKQNLGVWVEPNDLGLSAYLRCLLLLAYSVDLPSLMRILMPVIACLLTYCLLTQLGSNKQNLGVWVEPNDLGLSAYLRCLLLLAYYNFSSITLTEVHTYMFRGYKRFYRRAMLETSDYLKDDCLKINCTVGVVVSATHCPVVHSIKVPESDIGLNFGMLLETMEGSDAVFNVAGEIFHAHRLVLAARSSVFRADFFAQEGDDHEIVIADMDPKVFKAMLHFIYRDEINEDELVDSASSSESCVSDSLLAKLLAAADQYDLCRLKRMCESRFCKDISVSSVGRILALADANHAMELKAICLKFSSENLADLINVTLKASLLKAENDPKGNQAVMRSDGFHYLKTNHPALQSEILKTMAGGEEGYSSGGGVNKTTSVFGQLSDGGDTNERRVRRKN